MGERTKRVGDREYVQTWRNPGQKKRVPVGVVSCAVLLLVGRSAWAIWFQFGPVQIQARPSLPNDGASTEQRRARHGGCRLLFCGAGFPLMLRCTFGGTFTPPVKLARGQVTPNPPTNNPDATAVLELGAHSPALPSKAGIAARETKTDLGRQAGTHTRPHTTCSLMAEF